MYIHYNAGAGNKEVTLKNHGNKSRNGLAILHGNLIGIIMQVVTTYVHYSAGADELAIMRGNRFSS